MPDSLNSKALLPPWADELPMVLADLLNDDPICKREHYGTARMIGRVLEGRREIVAYTTPANVTKGPPLIEMLHADAADIFARHGLRFAPESVATSQIVLEHICGAIERHLDYLPGIRSSVSTLAWIVHVLLAESEDHDVSFSDPALPFSVFVSVPQTRRPDAELRVAEALIHEAMHLQLSLFERRHPLLQTGEVAAQVFSPWRQEYRDPIGILHGIYVFRVLKEHWAAVLRVSPVPFIKAVALRRIDEIVGQLAQVATFRESRVLTDAGRDLVNGLLA